MPQSFNALTDYLVNEIATLEEARKGAKFSEKRAIDKKLKPLRSLFEKCLMVQGK